MSYLPSEQTGRCEGKFSAISSISLDHHDLSKQRHFKTTYLVQQTQKRKQNNLVTGVTFPSKQMKHFTVRFLGNLALISTLMLKKIILYKENV